MVKRALDSAVPVDAIVWTEGKTDCAHLRKASERLRIGLNLSFRDPDGDDAGGEALLRKCKIFAQTHQATPMIFIFDRDVESIVTAVSRPTLGYRAWGNNVFSFALPIPQHRAAHSHICIELYYTDVELQTPDQESRRLFLTSEFSEKSGTHLEDPTIHIGNMGKLKGVTNASKTKIVDSQVYRDETNIALSKAIFAEYVEQGVGRFGDFDFAEFGRIFDLIELISAAARPRRHIALPDLRVFFADRETAEPPTARYADALSLALNILELTLSLFIATTVRCYEDAIVSEPPALARKVKPIKKVLVQRLKNPSLVTLNELARLCHHLIDETAPEILQKMKACLVTPFALGVIGQLLDELEIIYPPDATKPRLLNKANATRALLDYVSPELARYAARVETLGDDIQKAEMGGKLKSAVWREAAELLAAKTDEMLSQKFVLESLERVDTATGTYTVGIRTYQDGAKAVSHKRILFDELEEYGRNTSALVAAGPDGTRFVRLFPFLLISSDRLFYYKRTRAAGYEYFCIADNLVVVEETKRKFSQSVFNLGAKGAQQELFWTEVVPTKNPVNGITANIPSEGRVEFVGRKKQIATIRREILEIPNQNGIVYGVGGVGKTALMIEQSRELFDERDPDEVLFDNIIWVSAKSSYYNPTLDVVEPGIPQVDSLDTVVSAVLEFFGFEEVDGYSSEEKKELVLELLRENKVLLVLDNFETLPPSHKAAVIRFFEIDVKRVLRRQPANFKIIITSRELIPSGFHQIGLTGLDLREAKQLMSSSYKDYQGTNPELTDVQKEKLHQATAGIPIVIKHCLGQIYEYNRPFNSVVDTLAGIEARRVVEFSFEEVLGLLRSDRCQLETIILLEIINCPLMVRQIADILELDEAEIASKIPSLANYQCVKRINQGGDEKYVVNDEIRLLTRRLSQENAAVTQDIRRRMTRNFTIEKQMDYTSEEMGILGIFDTYLTDGNLLEAERFIREQISQKPHSILLKYHLAKHLKSQRGDIEDAIEILEDIREASNDHANVLRLLVACYTTLQIPNYARASVYVQQLEALNSEDEAVKFEVAEFYVRWSSALKMSRDTSPDPIKEMLRQQRYKELAEKAITGLEQLQSKGHEVYYLLGQSYFNKWEYSKALQMVDKAMSLCGRNAPCYGSYTYLRKLILTQRERRRGDDLSAPSFGTGVKRPRTAGGR